MRLIEKPITTPERKQLAQEIDGFFIKVVADLEKKNLVAGAKLHVDEEKFLLEAGSRQENLFGGGYDFEENRVTFDSIINCKPETNPSEEIIDQNIRAEFEKLVRYLLGL